MAMRMLNRLLIVVLGSWMYACQAQAELPILSAKDGCSDGEYIYPASGKVRSKMSLRDPVSHKMVMKNDPEGIRLECIKDADKGGYRWESLDKVINGKLVRAPGNETFVPSNPIGLTAKVSPEEEQLGVQQNRLCMSKDGSMSIGGILPSDKGDKFYRCVKIYDENFKVRGTGWVELVFKNGELVTTPN